jgi:replicative DNA helicase
MNDPVKEYRALGAMRNPENVHVLYQINLEYFTDNRPDILQAMRRAQTAYGSLTADAVVREYGRDLPAEMDILPQANLEALISDLARLHRKRELAALADEMKLASQAFDPDVTPFTSAVEKIALPDAIDTTLTTGTSAFIDMLSRKVRGDYEYLSTGITVLDSYLGGEWPRGEVTIITAKSGGGKTALMNTATLNGGTAGIGMGIFSLEMPRHQLIARWVPTLTGLDGKMLRAGRRSLKEPFSAGDLDKINKAVEFINTLPIEIIDYEIMDAPTIGAYIRKMHTKGRQVFFVDYLQLLSYDISRGMHYGLSDAVKYFARLAKSLQVSIILLAQLNNDDLIRDAGDADKPASLWINISIDPDRDDFGVHSATLQIKKNRHGPSGMRIPILYNGIYQQFTTAPTD